MNKSTQSIQWFGNNVVLKSLTQNLFKDNNSKSVTLTMRSGRWVGKVLRKTLNQILSSYYIWTKQIGKKMVQKTLMQKLKQKFCDIDLEVR